MKERKSLIELRIENLRIRTNIEQMYIDAISWNENVRKPGEAMIDPDPDGVMAAQWLNLYERQALTESEIYKQFETQLNRKKERFKAWKEANPADHKAMTVGTDKR